MPNTQATISADALREFTVKVFVASGISPGDAELASDVLIWASLRGVDTHGIRNLKRYYIDSAGGVGRRDGVIVSKAGLSVDRETPTTAALNANGGLGLSVSVQAMDRAISKASAHGIGLVTVRDSTHFGPAGYYAQMAVEHDMIGFASTGYFFPHGQPKAVVPFGGSLPMLSTNPLAMAFPSAGDFPFVLDMSTSVAPMNRIEMLEELDRPIPEGCALTKDHESTIAPADVTKLVPLGGATGYGGHKGSGLAIAAWILTGLLSGAWKRNAQMDRILGETAEPKHGFAQEGIGHSFAAVRLDSFIDSATAREGMEAMLRAVVESPAAGGFERVVVPGQLEHETAQQRSKQGIPLPTSTRADLESLSVLFGVPLELET